MVVGRFIGFARGVILTWLLSAGEYGLFYVAVAVVNVLVPLCGMGLSQGVLRYAPAHEVTGTLRRFVRRATLLTLAVGLAGCGVLVIFARPFGTWLFGTPHASAETDSPIRLVWATAICVYSLVVYHLVADLMKGLRLFRAASLMEVLGTVLFSSVAIVAPLLGFTRADAILLSYGLGNVATVFLVAPPLMRSIRKRAVGAPAAEPDSWIDGKLLRYSLWIAGTAMSWHLLQQYAFWHLAKVSGNELAGAYYAARLFAQLLVGGALTLSSSLSANVTRVWEAFDRREALSRLETGTKVGCLVILASAVPMSLAKHGLVRVYASQYAVAAECFDAVLLGFAWYAVLQFLSIRFHLEERSILSFWTSLAGALASIVFSLAWMGYPGEPATLDPTTMIVRAGWVCAGGAGVSVLVCLWLLRSRGGFRLATVGLILAPASLLAGGVYGSLLLVFLVVLSICGGAVFSTAERSMIVGWCRGR